MWVGSTENTLKLLCMKSKIIDLNYLMLEINVNLKSSYDIIVYWFTHLTKLLQFFPCSIEIQVKKLNRVPGTIL